MDDFLVDLTVSVILAYGAYLLADEVHLSGVLATVTAAVVFGNIGPGRTLKDTEADAVDTVWEFLAYLLTAFVFLVVGLAIPPARLVESIVPIAWAVVAALLGRALIVYGMLGGLGLLAPIPGMEARFPLGWLNVVFWSGLRGAVAVAMALSLPADVPQRDVLQAIVFGVVLFTLLVQGTTVGRLDGPRRADGGAGRRLMPDGLPVAAAYRRRKSPRCLSSAADTRRPLVRRIWSSSSRYWRPIGARSSHSMYSMSVRAISPSDQPENRPKLSTLPDGCPGGGPAAP